MTSAPIKVLVVDDDEDDYVIARDLFGEIDRARYVVDWAPSFHEALPVLGQNRHDVYLIDYRLGGENGLDLLKEAQAQGCRAPIILLTGQGEPDVDTAAMRAGAEDFLVKGQITAKQLERSVRYAIERKRAEREIQKLAAFPRCNPSPVLEFDEHGTITYWNEAAELLTESLQINSLGIILPANFRQLVAESLRTGENRADVRTTYENRTFAWRLVPIPANRVVHCYAAEITERLNLEAQLRHSVKMDAVGQLAAGVAHDFNNILTIVQGHANLLLALKKLDEESINSLKEIGSASERASNLIRQLLMFSSKQVMQPRTLDLNDVIAGVGRMLKRVLGEHITFQTQPATNLPYVHGDVGMIEQVLLNLAINARDAMPQGGKLTIGTSPAKFDDDIRHKNPNAHGGHFVCLTVTDTGTGIDPKILSRIFEPFFTTKGIGKGSGLGLATVYGICKQHDGWIDVESELGIGTQFRVYFPAFQDEENLRAGEAPAVEKKVPGGRETILVVEDEQALRELVRHILILHGYHVYAAAHGPEALKIWAEHKDEIQLLLTDMVMPGGLSGRDLAEKLLEQNPRLKIIYTSGYSPGMAGQDIALLDGFNFLPKPYPPARLAQLVRECLDADENRM